MNPDSRTTTAFRFSEASFVLTNVLQHADQEIMRLTAHCDFIVTADQPKDVRWVRQNGIGCTEKGDTEPVGASGTLLEQSMELA